MGSSQVAVTSLDSWIVQVLLYKIASEGVHVIYSFIYFDELFAVMKLKTETSSTFMHEIVFIIPLMYLKAIEDLYVWKCKLTLDIAD